MDYTKSAAPENGTGDENSKRKLSVGSGADTSMDVSTSEKKKKKKKQKLDEDAPDTSIAEAAEEPVSSLNQR